ncbi:hypothetical protein [Algoriphagus sp.]
MKSELSFYERAKLGMEQLSKQPPVTLAMARQQVQNLKTQSRSVNQKGMD